VMAEPKCNISVQMNEELMMKLGEISKVRYRGASVSQTVRWMVEDLWLQIQAEKDLLEGKTVVI
jgi:hypothetical protein